MKKSQSRRKSFDWYGLHQRFSIRKYYFGAASVLLGTALILGGNSSTAQADEVTATTDDAIVTDASANSSGSEQQSQAVETTATAASEAAQTASVESQAAASTQGTQSETAQEAPVAATAQVTETAHSQAASTASSQSEAAQVAASETATAPAASQVATASESQAQSQAQANFTTTATTANETADQAANQAQAAATDAKVQTDAAMAAAVVEMKKRGVVTDEQGQAILDAYAAGYLSEEEVKETIDAFANAGASVSPFVTLSAVASLNNPVKTVVESLKDITDAEVASIKHQVRVANPNLSAKDQIEVRTHTDGSSNEAGDVTVTFIDENTGATLGTEKILARNTVVSKAALANKDQLAESIKWFSLSSATRIYPDGTKAYPDGRVVYANGLTGRTTDANFRQNVAKFVSWDGKAGQYEALQEGMIFEIPTAVDGYVLTAKVSKLAPKDVSKDPVKDRYGQPTNATRIYDTSINPSAPGQTYRGTDPNYQAGVAADVIMIPQDATWSHMARGGIAPEGTTDNGDNAGLVGFSSNKNDSNVGVTFEFTATYKGREVAANIIAADAEEAGYGEVIQFVSDGTPWEEYTQVFSGENNGAVKIRPMTNTDLSVPDGSIVNNFQNAGYDASEWTNYVDGQPSAYGTNTFGPFYTKIGSNPVPVGVSRDVKNLSIYVNAYGMQSGMIGFVVEDLGDAPESYGVASHAQGNWTTGIDSGTPIIHSQPFLGTTAPDANFDVRQTNDPWVRDDNEDDQDEGEAQLVGTTYTVRQSNDSSYTLEHVRANPGQNNGTAYARAWADFNNNGKFDDDEASDVVVVTADGNYDFHFANAPQNMDTTQEKMGMRIRISLTEDEILRPTGTATTGEVEDFQVNVEIAPRGGKDETRAGKGATQTGKVDFNAYGKTKASGYTDANSIDTSVAPKIVTADGSLVDTYTEAGEGTYTIKGWNGTAVEVDFTPEADFVGTAKGVVIRATDANGTDTGWTVTDTTKASTPGAENNNNGVNGANTMDGVYIPTVTEDQTSTVKRTIKYFYEDKDGNRTPVEEDKVPTVEQSVSFTRPQYSTNDADWTVTSGDQNFAEVATPVLDGYIASRANVEAVTVNAGDQDLTEEVIYKKLGSFVPNVPAGETPIDPIPYPNDPNDPTKPGVPTEEIPGIDGYIPNGPDGTPLTPGSNGGYNPPLIPTDPTQDTPIDYTEVPQPDPVADKQKANISFVEETSGNELAKVTEEGDSNTAIPSTNYEDKLTEFQKQGYEVVSDNFGGNQSFDDDKDQDQDFKVVLKERVEPVKPGTDKPVPGQPVDPNDPNSPVWPDSVKDLVNEEAVTRTIKYVYAKDGSQASEDVVETLTFTREAQVNLVTGEITYGDWTATDTTFDQVDSPVITGYIADKANVAEKAGVQATDADFEAVVTYTELGSWIPKIPENQTPDTPASNTPYPNDPNDPTQPGEPINDNPDSGTPVVPHVDGYTPVDPNSGDPLKPVDPNDPSKGYVPPVPQVPTADTEIPYREDNPAVAKGQLIVQYVDKEGTALLPSENAEGEVGQSYTTTAKVVTGYILTETPDNAQGNYTEGTTTVTYVYDKLGSYVPNIPGQDVPDIPYPNDPTDPTKPMDPNDPDYPVIPDVPGYTPVDPNSGEPLKPVDPNDPSKGYEPPVPQDPTKDTPINYEPNTPAPVADKQKANISFVEETSGDELAKVTEEGDSNTAIPSTNYEDKLIEFHKQGYEVVSDDFGGNQTFDDDKDQDQDFKVVLKERVEPVKPGTDKPVPGQPVDPTDPNSPVWPDSVKDLVNEEAVTRTIKYVYAKDGSQASEDVVETLTFTREAQVNLVTGEITYGDWTATDTTFDQVDSPVITGYIADKASVAEKAGVQATDADFEEVVTYTELGSYVPNIPGQDVPEIPYPNDPNDPTKPMDPNDPDYPVIPDVPGYTPVDPNSGEPLKPVDPNDPSKGYVPPVPEDPTKDTPIDYTENPKPNDGNNDTPTPVADKQKANISFVEETSGDELAKVTEEGDSNTAIPSTNYEDKLTEFHKQGYEVVSDNFGGNQSFDDDKDQDQDFKVVLKERVEPVKPGTDKPVPGQPVDPTDPNSPVWPDSVKDLVNEEAVTRTIKYVYADGSKASDDVVETLTFTRTAKVNLVTGEVTYGDWTATDTSFDQVDSPVITGYIADKASVAEKAGVQATDADSEEVVTYTELGSYVPNIPGQDVPDIPYPNDPTDPTKPMDPNDPDYPVIPDVPGYTPVDPNTGNPLDPVDPNDPSKGYVPPVPQDPTKDTPIDYTENPKPNDGNNDTPTPVADKQKANIHFVEETSGNELDKVTEEGDSNTTIPSDNYNGKITDFHKKGYEVVSDDFGGNQSFDDDKDQDQDFKVVLKERVEPVKPGTDKPVPGQPVDPNDPNSPVWPDSVKDLVNEEAVTRTIKYVYAKDGSQASEDVVETLTFTREAQVNLVTGEITYGDWTATDTTFDQVDSPVITGYIADKASVAEKAGVQATDADSVEVVSYVKLGSYEIDIPGQGIVEVPYPNDPNDPTKPMDPNDPNYPKVPYIDGYIPVDPITNQPLKPVDPNDPTQGYIPSVPQDPTKNTPIKYVPANPSDPGQPNNPGTPTKTETKTPGKQNPGTPAKKLDNKEDLNKSKKADKKAEELPETGDQAQGMLVAGLSALAAGFGLIGLGKKRKDEN